MANARAAREERARAAVVERLKEIELIPTYTATPDADGNRVLGCLHYSRSCKSRMSCCGVFTPCRLCHDEAFEMVDGHVCDRRAITTVLCMRCDEVQPVGVACTKCKQPFSDYHCRECVLYAGTESPIYHCAKCGICRIGTADTNVHCEDCNACVLKAHARTHACTPSSMTGNCPVCCLPLFTSTKQCVYLPCGHSMHQACFEELLVRDFRCALCLKACVDMREYNRAIARRLAAEDPLSPALASRRSEILCNDCTRRSVTSWHYEHHMCQSEDVVEGGERRLCGSFNTRVLKVLDLPTAGSNPATDDSGRSSPS